MITWKLLAIAFGAATVVLATLVSWQLVERARLRRRFAGTFDLHRELAARRGAFDRQIAAQAADIERAHRQALQELADVVRTTRDLRVHEAAWRGACERLRGELAALERQAAERSVGLSEPTSPGASSDHRARLLEARAQQKAALHAAQAVTYHAAWSLRGSRRVGARVQQLCAKLMLRAFNAECEAARAQVAWDHVWTLERIELAFEAINQTGREVQVAITPRYRELKIDELKLEYQLAQQRREPPDERWLAQQRARQELDRARAAAQAEQLRIQRALDQARDELAMLHGDARDDQLGRLATIQGELRAAERRTAELVAQQPAPDGERPVHDPALGLPAASDNFDAWPRAPSPLPDGSSSQLAV